MMSRPALEFGWTLWPHVLVRGAGFPFAKLDATFRSNDWQSAIRFAAADPQFREAVTWQNRPAVLNVLDPLVIAITGKKPARLLKKQLLVAKYLQRYCAKNDTIGFFGPVGWAVAGRHGRFSACPALIDARQTFFEPWAVLTLARRCQDNDARLRAPVFLPGHLRIQSQAVLGPEKLIPLTAGELSVVHLANGRPAVDLLGELATTAEAQTDWRGILERLVREGILRWEFPVSVSLEPERLWRTAAVNIDMDALSAKRDDVARASGDHIKLGQAMKSLENEFERRTGVAAWRNSGQTYAGRGLVFEECRRAISMDLGRATIERVAPALSVVLRIARWYTFSIGTVLAQALLREFERLRQGIAIPLHVFWRHTAPLFEVEVPPAVAQVVADLQSRWSTMWQRAQHRDNRLYLDVESAVEFVGKHFEAPCPGWPSARHHAPDLMWDAPSPSAFLAGSGTPVLSELHPGVTPFSTLSVLSLCPVRQELEAEWQDDFPHPLVSPIPSEDFARSSPDARLAHKHWHLDLGRAFASDRTNEQVLKVADMDVVNRGGTLIAAHRTGGPELDLLSVFERRIKLRAAVNFNLSDHVQAGTEHGLRRYLGPLVVQRAHWRTGVLPFLDSKADRLMQVQSWRSQFALPERLFVRLPTEVKPIYVDLTSEISVEMLVRFARQAPYLLLSEMFPGPDGLWLRDSSDQSYTSELRMLAVDPQPYDPARVWNGATSQG
ncbi:lantibiotic dehydratase family protein [bacterium]|nr:lantibiotic dehydratase family protein [bacterium]